MSPLWRARHIGGVVVRAISAAGLILQERRAGIVRSGQLVITLPSSDAHALRLEGAEGPRARVELGPRAVS